MMNKRQLYLSLFILGLTSLVGQMILIRELSISFYGNEFFIGIILAFWLLWVGIGGFTGYFTTRVWKKINFLIVIQLTFAALLFFEIFFIRYFKGSIGFAGEIPNLVTSLLAAIIFPSLLCLILGIWWTHATKLIADNSEEKSLSVNHAYFMETFGFIAGGILFSFVLVKLPSFLIAYILLGVTFISAIFLINKTLLFKLALACTLILFIGIFYQYIPTLEKLSLNYIYKNQSILETTNSLYGQVTVTETNGQQNYYESGLLLGSDNETELAEQLVHFPMLETSNPKNILLIGGGFNGALKEILKYDIEKVYYLELDPELIKIAKKHLPPDLKNDLLNPKVNIINTDGFYFLKTAQQKFDAIIINLPDPSTALINRYYTKEFFELVKKKLDDNGVFSTHLSFAPDRPTPSLIDLNTFVYNTLKNVFSHVITLPQETNLLIAGNSNDLTYDPKLLVERLKQRNIENKFVIADYITYRLTTDQIPEAEQLFSNNKGTKENFIFRPIAYFYNTLFWLTHFYPKASRWFAMFAKNIWFIPIPLILLISLIIRNTKYQGKEAIASVTIAGFSLMSLEIIIIYIYQTLVGFLYYRLSLLIASIMAGMALGIWLGNQSIKKGKIIFFSLIKLHLLLGLFCIILFIIFVSTKSAPMTITEPVIFLSTILAGLLSSVIFPLANHLYLSKQAEPERKTGYIYSADLIGASIGAILPSLIFLPIFGVWYTLVFIVLMNLSVIILFQKPAQ